MEKQKRILFNTQFQAVQQNKKISGKKRPIGPQKKCHEKVHEKRKRFKNDAINQAKEASPHTALNATAMEDSIFSSASAGLSRSSQVVLLKARFPSGRTLIEKSIF